MSNGQWSPPGAAGSKDESKIQSLLGAAPLQTVANRARRRSFGRLGSSGRHRWTDADAPPPKRSMGAPLVGRAFGSTTRPLEGWWAARVPRNRTIDRARR